MNIKSPSIKRVRKRCGVANQKYAELHYQQQQQQQQQEEEEENHRHYDSNDNYNFDNALPPVSTNVVNDRYYDDNYNFSYRISTPPQHHQQPQQQYYRNDVHISTPHNTVLSTTYYTEKNSLFPSPPSLSSPLISKSIVSAYTPVTTTTGASTATSWSYTLHRNVSPTKLPPPRLEPLPQHWNHDECIYSHRNNDTESAIQFVERTTSEMHEIVQYWLSRDSLPPPPPQLEISEAYDSVDASPILEDDLSLGSTLTPLRNNTLWNSIDDNCSESDYDAGDGGNDSYFYECFHFQALYNRYGERMNDFFSMNDENNNFDASVEEFFTRTEECQCRTRTDSCYIDNYDGNDPQQLLLHQFASILYQSCSNGMQQKEEKQPLASSYCLQTQCNSTSPQHQILLRRQKLNHPYIIVHTPKTSISNNTITVKSLWQWIDEQWNQNYDLPRQQLFRRRVWNLIFIIVSSLTLLLVGLLFLVSIQYVSMMTGWYRIYLVQNDDK